MGNTMFPFILINLVAETKKVKTFSCEQWKRKRKFLRIFKYFFAETKNNFLQKFLAIFNMLPLMYFLMVF